MKRRFLLLFLFIIGISTTNFSQNKTTFGIKAGINFTGFHTGTSTYTGEFWINTGIILEHRISNLISIQPELVFNQKAGNYIILGNEMVITAISKLKYLDIPIMAKINFIENLNLQLGPQIGFLLSEKTDYDSNEIEIEPEFLDFAINGGLGYQTKYNIFVQARYSYGLKEIFENRNYKNSVISLSIGYKFKN